MFLLFFFICSAHHHLVFILQSPTKFFIMLGKCPLCEQVVWTSFSSSSLCITFSGDRCQFKGPCAYLDCENGAECMQTLSQDELSFTGGCECLQGYNGTLCENEIDWCANSPCQNGATCNSTLAGPECTCVPFFGGMYHLFFFTAH